MNPLFVALALVRIVSAQPNLNGQWGQEICVPYNFPSLSLYGHSTFVANDSDYTLTLTFYMSPYCISSAIAQITASGPYDVVGTSGATGCTLGNPGQVYDVTLYANVTKSFIYYNNVYTSLISPLCNWTTTITANVEIDIRNLNCSSLGLVSCPLGQPQIVQESSTPDRIYFGAASSTSSASDACTEASRPTIVQPVAFVKNMTTPGQNTTLCFPAPLAPTSQGNSGTPIQSPVSAPVGVPVLNNINPVSTASIRQHAMLLGLVFALL